MTQWYRSPAEVRAEVARSRKPALSVLDSETSNEAARSIEPHRGDLRERVFQAIAARAEGATAQEMEALTGLAGNTIRPRLVELYEANRIRRSGEKRRTKSGRRAEVWIVL